MLIIKKLRMLPQAAVDCGEKKKAVRCPLMRCSSWPLPSTSDPHLALGGQPDRTSEKQKNKTPSRVSLREGRPVECHVVLVIPIPTQRATTTLVKEVGATASDVATRHLEFKDPVNDPLVGRQSQSKL